MTLPASGESVSVLSSVGLVAAVLLVIPGDSGIICTISSSSCIAECSCCCNVFML